MPALDNVQKHMMLVANEHAQNKEMLQNLDQALSKYALRHEIIEYSTELRKLLKKETFEMHEERAEKFFTAFKAEFKDLKGKVDGRDAGNDSMIRKAIHDMMIKYQAN